MTYSELKLQMKAQTAIILFLFKDFSGYHHHYLKFKNAEYA